MPLKALLKLNAAKMSTLIRPQDEICVQIADLTTNVQYTQQDVIQIIREIWPDELEQRAIAIARRESNLYPDAIGVPNKCCFGLFQIYYKWHKNWLPKLGVTDSSQLLEPRTNAIVALEIYRRSNGWTPWNP